MDCFPRLTLDDLLDDPMVRLVMARDRVEPDSVRRLVGDVARRISASRSQGSAARGA